MRIRQKPERKKDFEHGMRKKINALEQLIQMVDVQLQQLLQSNLQELHLTVRQIHTLERQKRELKNMLGRCGIGDIVAKKYIIHTIREILTEKIQITEEELEFLFPIKQLRHMSERDMFERMLLCYEREHGKKALAAWIEEHAFENCINEKSGVYEIAKEQVRFAFEKGTYDISHMERLNLVAQRVYAEYRGLGVIDEIRDMDIDGVSGGVNGMGEEERSVWIMFRGKSIYLSFLCFGSKKKLQRICRTIYRYGQPGQLSKSKGYVVNEMADHARVVVARPDFCENWVFFVRKLDNLESKRLEDLFAEEGAEIVILLLQYIVKGCQTLGITGTQGSGKTTLLMSLIAYVSGSFTLRIQEAAFELQLRRLYPERNIVSFRETESVSAQEGLDLQKKTDGTVSIVGEVASAKQAALMLQLGQTASLYTMFTHHANSTRNLIWALQNNLLQAGQFSKEEIAQQQVVEVVRFHVHLTKGIRGERYIDSITEIVPLSHKNQLYQYFDERVLVHRVNGKYQFIQNISEDSLRKMAVYMTEEEKQYYDQKMVSYFREDSLPEIRASTNEKIHGNLLSGG